MDVIETRKNRTTQLIANFVGEGDVGEFAHGWKFKVPKAFKTSLDIKETRQVINKVAYLVWTQGENYSFEIGDTFHNYNGLKNQDNFSA